MVTKTGARKKKKKKKKSPCHFHINISNKLQDDYVIFKIINPSNESILFQTSNKLNVSYKPLYKIFLLHEHC